MTPVNTFLKKFLYFFSWPTRKRFWRVQNALNKCFLRIWSIPNCMIWEKGCRDGKKDIRGRFSRARRRPLLCIEIPRPIHTAAPSSRTGLAVALAHFFRRFKKSSTILDESGRNRWTLGSEGIIKSFEKAPAPKLNIMQNISCIFNIIMISYWYKRRLLNDGSSTQAAGRPG